MSYPMDPERDKRSPGGDFLGLEIHSGQESRPQRTLHIYVAPDIQNSVSWAGKAICSCRHDEETDAAHCGANQNIVLHDAVLLDETARPEVLMETGIYQSR